MNRLVSYAKTALLFAFLTGLLLAIGYMTHQVLLFFIISLVINFGSYWFSDKIALSMAHAQPIEESQAPELYADVRDLAQKMDLPAPKVIYISPEMQSNAFATGRNPNHSAICVTQGLMKVLNREEVKAVLAHEMGHVKNYDVLISTVAVVVAGTISSLAQMAMWFGGGSDDENRNPIASIALLILAPIAATLIQLAISRSREYAADETGSEYSGKPRELANALIKIDNNVQQIPMNVNPAISSLFIENPLKAEGGITSLFSTHPSTADRVARLMQMQEKP